MTLLRVELVRLGDGERVEGVAAGICEDWPLAVTEVDVSDPVSVVTVPAGAEYAMLHVLTPGGAVVIGSAVAMSAGLGLHIDAGTSRTIRVRAGNDIHAAAVIGVPASMPAAAADSMLALLDTIYQAQLAANATLSQIHDALSGGSDPPL